VAGLSAERYVRSGFAGFLLSNESSYVSAPALLAGGGFEHRGFQASRPNAGYFLAGS
jgi:hypothetical protein